MEENDKLADMAEKNPRKALYYIGVSIILFLLGYIARLEIKLDAAVKDKEASEAALVLKYEAIIAVKDKTIEYYSGMIISRADISADQWAKHYQSLLNKLEKQNLRRTRNESEQDYLRKKDASNIKELEGKKPNTENGN